MPWITDPATEARVCVCSECGAIATGYSYTYDCAFCTKCGAWAEDFCHCEPGTGCPFADNGPRPEDARAETEMDFWYD